MALALVPQPASLSAALRTVHRCREWLGEEKMSPHRHIWALQPGGILWWCGGSCVGGLYGPAWQARAILKHVA
eukprot:364473-Chlamydomonas_euryale.AAC.7